MSKPVLSVVIPVYNNESYMRETLECILKSTYNNLEILVINDGSTDKSAQIASAMSEADERIRVLSKPNGGVVSARNLGLEVATGDYICFMDQDDIVEPFMYEQIISKMLSCNSEIGICSSAKLISGHKELLDVQDDAVFIGDEIASNLLLPMLYNDFDVPRNYKRVRRENHIWVCIFSRVFLVENNIRFRAYVDFEDDLLVKTEALTLAKCVCTVSTVGYYWRIHKKSESHAHRIVYDIGLKQDMEYGDLIKSLSNIEGLSEDQLTRRIIFCKQYIKAIINSTCAENCKSVRDIKAYYHQNIYSREFDDSIKALMYLKTNKLRWRILFVLIRRRLTILCYLAERAFEVIHG